MHKYLSALVVLLAWAALAGSAQAHIKLIKPEPWINEDDSGGPQKGGPCGPGGFDDVQPVPVSMKVTTVTAGDMLMVEFEETIHHPGWFRIALAEDPNDFEEIAFPNTNNCTYDMSKVPTAPHGNVLADGLGMDTDIGGPNRKFMEMVKLPDMPCEKCTLQVIQVMADALHAPPGCIYYHCAELKIVAKDGVAAAAGSGGSAAGSGGASGGSSAAGKASAAAPAAGSGSGGMGGMGGIGGAHAHAGSGGMTTTPGAGAAGNKPGTPSLTPFDGMSAQAGSAAMDAPSAGGCSVSRVAGRADFTMSALGLGLAALWLSRRKRAA